MRILLLEPNPLLASALQRGLHEEGDRVEQAMDLSQAKALAESNHFDVIVLDIPQQMELAVLQYWRRVQICAPVLFLSMPGNHEAKFAGRSLGPAAFLTKPFHFEELLATLRRLAQSVPEAAPTFDGPRISTLASARADWAHAS